ncbi:hypothetical protein SAMN05216319_4192 [Duganella sp. CF402]|uniref:hypothetical protein n=1 Tax=unclassified Duganella TaxID=2636909 RepID=UPI0008B9A9CC|nr:MULTISPECIES: hypothetical protein [unclassified Duganella]RZT04031.1 hypothetical protein EV582_4912 [Duganella sp. BK701]SEM50761.1 hypothetical protein SAMN05216319_4192 [Duganella sp. CF402]
MKTTILRQFIVLPMLAAVMAALHACGSTGGNSGNSGGNNASRSATPAPFSQTYVLRQGGSVVITPAIAAGRSASMASAAPVVRLERVNDSRCRTGAVCVWAGYISFSFTVQQPDGSASNFVLSDNMPNGSPNATRDGLNFALTGFTPQQVPGKNDSAPDYQVSLKVSNINSP